MNILVIPILCQLIVYIYAKSNIIYKSPNISISADTHEFQVSMDQMKLPAYIHVYNAMTDELIYQTDTKNITYVNQALIVHIPDTIGRMDGTKYYITLSEGVSESDNTLTSTVQTSSIFSPSDAVNSSITITLNAISASTNIGTTESITNKHSDEITQITKSTTSRQTVITGEPPPTRSAQLGMGLGITLIGIFLIGEIIFFKYFYRSGQRNNNYMP